MELEKEFDPTFEQLKLHVKSLLDFNTFQYKDSYLGRRFDSRLRALHLDSYNAYWDFLKKDTAEQEKLLSELTINVTEFFRDNTVYDAFIKRKNRKNPYMECRMLRRKRSV